MLNHWDNGIKTNCSIQYNSAHMDNTDSDLQHGHKDVESLVEHLANGMINQWTNEKLMGLLEKGCAIRAGGRKDFKQNRRNELKRRRFMIGLDFETDIDRWILNCNQDAILSWESIEMIWLDLILCLYLSLLFFFFFFFSSMLSSSTRNTFQITSLNAVLKLIWRW